MRLWAYDVTAGLPRRFIESPILRLVPRSGVFIHGVTFWA
jgi:hypothetical protein